VAGRWTDARDAFTKALEDAAPPEALAGLGEAEWWLGDTTSAIDHLGRAYAAFLRRPDPARATVCAVRLCLVSWNSLGRRAVTRGWLRRAARLTEENHLEPLRGWVQLLTGGASGDPEPAANAAQEAAAHAARFGDPDLELCARSQLGASLVQMGRVEEGTALLDETMAGALAGEGKRLDTVVFTSCNTVTACNRVAEFERALQWIRAAADFSDRYGSPHVYTLCRTHHARLLFLAGDWQGAERHFQAALRAGHDAAVGRPSEATPPDDGLAGRRGFLKVMAPDADRAELTAGLGSDYETLKNRYKPYACGVVTHAAIDAAIEARNSGIQAERVRSIRAHVHPLVEELTAKTDLRRGLEGKFSVFHCMSVGLIDGRAGPQQFTDARVADPAVVALARKTELVVEPGMGEESVRVDIELDDGEQRSFSVPSASGSLERPLTDRALEEKFTMLVGEFRGSSEAASLIDAVWSMGKRTRVREFVARLPALADA